MKREIFAKIPIPLEAFLLNDEVGLKRKRGCREESREPESKKKPCSGLEVSKSEHGYIL